MAMDMVELMVILLFMVLRVVLLELRLLIGRLSRSLILLTKFVAGEGEDEGMSYDYE
jgi:hypothetical protein